MAGEEPVRQAELLRGALTVRELLGDDASEIEEQRALLRELEAAGQKRAPRRQHLPSTPSLACHAAATRRMNVGSRELRGAEGRSSRSINVRELTLPRHQMPLGVPSTPPDCCAIRCYGHLFDALHMPVMLHASGSVYKHATIARTTHAQREVKKHSIAVSTPHNHQASVASPPHCLPIDTHPPLPAPPTLTVHPLLPLTHPTHPSPPLPSPLPSLPPSTTGREPSTAPTLQG